MPRARSYHQFACAHALQHSFDAHLHHDGYEYFLSTDLARPAASPTLLVAPIRAWIADGDTSFIDAGRPNGPRRDELPRGRCPRGTCNPNRYLLPAVRRLSECYYAVQKEEGRQSRRYGAVLRLRPDHVFLRPMPRITDNEWLAESLVPGRLLLWDDQIAAARRDDAAAALLAPSVAYATCADEGQWREAVARSGESAHPSWRLSACRESAEIPCTSMALVTIFGSATSWRHLPLRPRSWRPYVGPSSPDAEDFCIQRARPRINESWSETPSAIPRFNPSVGMSC